MVGEGAVGLEVEPVQSGLEPGEDLLDCHSGHPVPAVDGNLQWTDRRPIDDVEEMVDVIVDGVDGAHRAGRGSRRCLVIDHRLLDVLQPGLRPYRSGAGPAQLQSVVFRRVVRGSDDRPRDRVLARVEIDEIGRHLPQIDHVGAGGRDPIHQRLEQRIRRPPAVPANGDLIGVDQRNESGADLPVQIRSHIAVVGAPANVIGLEHGIGAHRRRSLGVGLSLAHFYTCARMRPTFSIVVPVYNEAEFIPQAIPALIEQMDGIGEPYRILLVENGSTDGTRGRGRTGRSGPSRHGHVPRRRRLRRGDAARVPRGRRRLGGQFRHRLLLGRLPEESARLG